MHRPHDGSAVFVMQLGDRLVEVSVRDLGPANVSLSIDHEIAELTAMVEGLTRQVHELRAERLATRCAHMPVASKLKH